VCQLSLLPPVFVIVTTCPGGFGIPCVVLKFRLSGVAPIIGSEGDGGDCTTNCTITVCVLWAARNEIVLTYVPGFSMAALAATATTARAEAFNCPLAGVTVSQFATETAFQPITPAQLDVALKLSDWLLGLP